MKAFLSHSSHDKEFVRAVAQELGRQFCVFDEQAFDTGEEFKASIEKGLDDSSVFVLFASRKALDSFWVAFEVDEAWFKKLRARLAKSLVYLIDSSVTPGDLPGWLQRSLARRGNSAKVLARDIRHHIDDLLRERQYPYFVNRVREVEQLEQALTPIDGSTPPRAVVVVGLPGIGRRSLVKHTAPNILTLRKFVEIRVGDGDSINDICVQVADRVEPYATKDLFEQLVREILNLPEQDAVQRILKNLRALVEGGELPIFYDDGGLLDTNGYIRDSILQITKSLSPNDVAYLFFVSGRRPRESIDLFLPVIFVEPLKRDDVKRLLAILAEPASVKVSPDQISEIAEYIAGYPPAAYFAIQQAKIYGPEPIMRDKQRLVHFRTSVFLRHLGKINFDDRDRDLLRLLAIYSPLPFPVLQSVIAMNEKTLDDKLVRFIDLALITATQDGYYRIADPVADASIAAFGLPDEEQHRKLTGELYNFLEEAPIEGPRLELSRVLFRAAKWTGNKDIANKVVRLSNDLIRLTENLYHARKYDQAVEMGYAAVEERPESYNARSFLIRALIQEEKWQGAEKQIGKLTNHATRRDILFLRGFLERKRGDIAAAIDNFEQSVKLGRQDAAISRELALSYFLKGQMDDATRHINDALRRHSDNPYLIDLSIKIAEHKRDEAAIREGLKRFEIIAKPVYYYYRLSRCEFAFGRLPEAYTAAKAAVDSEDSPPFEVLAQLTVCQIATGVNLQNAEDLLTRLDAQYQNTRRDIRLALHCRLEIVRKRFAQAISLSEGMRNKATPYYKRIRRDALVGELSGSVLADKLRKEYEAERSRLDTELMTGSISDQLLPDDFPVQHTE